MILTKRLYSGPILKEMDAEAEQKRWVEWFTQASVWCEQVEHMASNQYAGISRKQKKKKKEKKTGAQKRLSLLTRRDNTPRPIFPLHPNYFAKTNVNFMLGAAPHKACLLTVTFKVHKRNDNTYLGVVWFRRGNLRE